MPERVQRTQREREYRIAGMDFEIPSKMPFREVTFAVLKAEIIEVQQKDGLGAVEENTRKMMDLLEQYFSRNNEQSIPVERVKDLIQQPGALYNYRGLGAKFCKIIRKALRNACLRGMSAIDVID